MKIFVTHEETYSHNEREIYRCKRVKHFEDYDAILYPVLSQNVVLIRSQDKLSSLINVANKMGDDDAFNEDSKKQNVLNYIKKNKLGLLSYFDANACKIDLLRLSTARDNEDIFLSSLDVVCELNVKSSMFRTVEQSQRQQAIEMNQLILHLDKIAVKNAAAINGAIAICKLENIRNISTENLLSCASDDAEYIVNNKHFKSAFKRTKFAEYIKELNA